MDETNHPFDKAATTRDMEAEQLKARVTWFYFVGGLTQQEIADRVGATRLRVNKILGQVRSDGSVVVDIRLPMAKCVELEQRLASRFCLDHVTVVPALADPAEQQRVIGDAAGIMLDNLLENGMGLGVGWGKTLAAGLRRMTPRSLPDSWVTSMMGGVTRGSGSSTFEVATGYARIIGADCYYLVAPLYFPTVESREILLSHLGIRETMRKARAVDVALLSCGDMTERSLLIKVPTVVENLDALLAAGAVGDLLGVFLDKDGNPVDHALNERVLSLSLAELKSVPHSILASGGMHKVPVIQAILNAGYVRRLVTDEECAAALLERAGADASFPVSSSP